ncbi:MAG: response regulator, partial [Betaproteobacteria bacterium]|nr:response regulator [Betaproteobacteria bacterium]
NLVSHSHIPGNFLHRLSKPVKDMELLAALRGERNPMAIQAVPPPLQGIGNLRQLNILVVEDDPIGRQLAQHVLSRVGHRVATADSGPAALAAIGDERFDLVLMDLQMPGMTGIDTTQAIRRREASTGRHLPVIALTARAMAEDGRRCLMAGMDACLIKPIQPVDLIRAIERLGQEHRLTPDPDPEPSDHRPLAGFAVPPRAPVLQRESLLERVGNDRRLLSEVVALFLARTPELLRNGDAALARGDGEQFRYVVHTLAGMFRSLSAPAALEAAEALESEGAAGSLEGLECLEGGHARLGHEVERLKEELQALADAAE